VTGRVATGPAGVPQRDAFAWAAVLADLGWTGRQTVNLGETLVDRHAGGDRVALRWFGRDGSERTVTYRELARLSDRFANLMRSFGVAKGDRVALVMPRVPETVVAMIGTWKAGAIYVPIFAGFAAEAIGYRVGDSGARLVLTHADTRSRLPREWPHALRILTVADAQGRGLEPGDADYRREMEGAAEGGEAVPCRREDPAALIYTSGSTGPSKGVSIATNFPASIWPAMRYGTDIRAGDAFWPTGDPGWGYGLVCYALALTSGVPVHIWEAAPTAETALAFIARHRITNLATVPTLLRGIMALGAEAVARHATEVRALSCCGEPLNAEVVQFFQRAWGVSPLDQFGSSEQGIPVGNTQVLPMTIRPGSMGMTHPGHRVAIVDEDGHELPRGTVGLIGSRPPPDGRYALGYWNAPEASPAYYRGGWICTGDLGRQDEDGYLWFEGRSDDVIKSAGYRIGPFEVESALLTHPAVAEAGVVGRPDPLRGQVVTAFVVLNPGHADSPDLRTEIAEAAKRVVGNHAYPRVVEIVPDLPKTQTGKIQRFLLRRD
jgi:acetyl-CoA synthetase